MDRRHPCVVNVEEVPSMDLGQMFGVSPERMGGYGAKVRRLGAAAGAKQIGCSLYEVEPGKAAYPRHWHLANEEAVIVIAGAGTLHVGDAKIEVRAGDYVAMPTGAENAHFLENTGKETLRYYCLSTMNDPEIAGYPDSKKIGFLSRKDGKMLRGLYREEETRDYFDRDPRAGKPPT